MSKTVLMLFPSPINLIVDGKMVSFGAGPQEVPEDLADHWYLKDHGVKRFSEVTPTKKTSKAAGQSADEEDEEPRPDFEAMTKAELEEFATANDIEGVDDSMKKDEMIAVIEEALDEREGD